MSGDILRIINTYDDEVAKARTLKHRCQPAWADAKSKAVKALSTLLSQELKERDVNFTVEELEVLQECFISNARRIYITPERSKDAPIYKTLEARLKEINND